MTADDIRRVAAAETIDLMDDPSDPVKIIKLKAINGFAQYLINLEALKQSNRIDELCRLKKLADEWLEGTPAGTQTVIIKDSESLTIINLKESNARIT